MQAWKHSAASFLQCCYPRVSSLEAPGDRFEVFFLDLEGYSVGLDLGNSGLGLEVCDLAIGLEITS